ncbi:MAG: penicillin acylase family protein [Candidatus Marinimicrobia bacterium]|nr:penicillin acylase family protein [Candidatus Neomarinimicrobiota bacterium]
MNKLRWALVIIVVLIIIIFAWLKLVYLKGPLATHEGTLDMPQLSAPVTIYTDEYGVPHVYAENEDDLFFAAAYLQASERLYKMDVIARAVEGRLSEVLGPDLIEDDKYLRVWGFHRTAKNLVNTLEPDTRRILERGLEGINAYIDEHLEDLPVEFKIAGYQPLHWKLEHMIGYARLMGHDLCLAWMPEVIFGGVLEKLGEEKARELYPVYPDTKPYIVPQIPENFSETAEFMFKSEKKIREITGAVGSHIGSNSWVLSGSMTKSGYPILSNDPHLGYSQPAVWYEMHLVGGRFDVSGVTLAGIPLVILGQNQHYAWGFTNVMVDDTDFYTEVTDADHPDQYFYDGEWRDMILHEEIIAVKGENPVNFIVRETHHGPIINDVHKVLSANESPPISMCWVGNYLTNEVEAFVGLNTASNWDEFTNAVEKFWIPGQNMIYADVDGNIGWRPAVALPLRVKGAGMVPLPGDDPQWDWQGFVPFDEMPFQYNPDQGYIATANNKTIGDEFHYYISAYWEPPARANRINQLLRIPDKRYDVEDMKNIQLDILSDHARDLAPLFVNLLETADLSKPNMMAAYKSLKDWDYIQGKHSLAAAVFNMLWVKFAYNLYGDEMDLIGPEFKDGFFKLANISIRNAIFLLEQVPSSSWFDDVSTPDLTETAAMIAERSLQESVSDLELRFGENIEDWVWSEMHTLTHPHPMAKVKILDWLLDLNVGPFPAGGSGTTVNNMEYRMYDPFDVVLGPSVRHIYDFANFQKGALSVLPTGQSGNPRSEHYADQAEMFNTGQYRVMPIDEETVKNAGYKKLVMNP